MKTTPFLTCVNISAFPLVRCSTLTVKNCLPYSSDSLDSKAFPTDFRDRQQPASLPSQQAPPKQAYPRPPGPPSTASPPHRGRGASRGPPHHGLTARPRLSPRTALRSPLPPPTARRRFGSTGGGPAPPADGARGTAKGEVGGGERERGGG